MKTDMNYYFQLLTLALRQLLWAKKAGALLFTEHSVHLVFSSKISAKNSEYRVIPLNSKGEPEPPGLPASRCSAYWRLVLPAQLCAFKSVNLPSQQLPELRQMVGYQLPRLIPYNRDEWVFDVLISRQLADGSADCLIVAVRRSVLDSFLQKARSLGVEIQAVTITALAALAASHPHPSSQEEQPTGLLVCHPEWMDFLVETHSKVLFCRATQTSPVGPGQTESLATEVGRSLGVLRGQVDAVPRRCHVLADNDKAESLAKSLSRDIPDVEFIPFSDSTSASGVNENRLERFLLTAAVSGANVSQAINLLSNEDKAQQALIRRIHRTSRKVVQVAGLLALALVLAYACADRQHRILSQYQQRLAQIAPAARKVQAHQQQLAVIKEQLHSNTVSLEILAELYRVLPEDITVHEVSLNAAGQLVLRGQARQLYQAFDCIGLLERSDLFVDVRQDYAQQRQIAGKVLIDFQVTAGLEKNHSARGAS